MFIVESLHGVVLDSDKSKKDLIARHKKHSLNPAKVFKLENGIKQFIEQI